ncbi:RNA ligase [Halorarum salinum]|uniref:RNA ligase n=1 Tax=Halorarum salinum TaxID=2743089 RepID=A0A7D5L9T4_9EURY|nr:RNA ligase [Halobaculum salinum]QLG61428.1 RNA ligase [Halobaculum salinum]
MDQREYLARLNPTTEDPEELFEHFERRSAAGRTLHALPDARHGVERGTVVVEDADAVVRGYPSLPRVLVLGTGLPAFFEPGTTVDVEEKLDGFNVRIADVGEPLAFTRSGFVCPYTTARARERLPLTAFFEDHPDEMLCAEFIGPESPYTTYDYDDVDTDAFRVFDVRDRESGDPLPVAERRDRCEAYGLPQPRHFGRRDPEGAVDVVRDAVATLDAAGREGVVVRSADGRAAVKYTTETQHHDELAYAFSVPFDYGREFLLSRVVRDAFQAAEFDEDDDRLRERAHDLGESILLPMVEAIRDVEEGATVGERHVVRGDPDAVEALLDHLRDRSLTLETEADRREDGDRVVEFLKVAESTRDRVRYYLDGGTRDE